MAARFVLDESLCHIDSLEVRTRRYRKLVWLSVLLLCIFEGLVFLGFVWLLPLEGKQARPNFNMVSAGLAWILSIWLAWLAWGRKAENLR